MIGVKTFMNFAYYIFLLLIIFLSFFTLKRNLCVSPKKIKIYLTFVITLFLLRHIGLLMLCILKSSNIIYYIKPIIYLNHIAMPLIILAITYVYLRSETLKFTGSYIILSIVVLIYIYIIRVSKLTIEVSQIYGFIMNISNETEMYLLSLIFMGILLVLNVMLLDKPYANKVGIWFIIISIVVVMLEEVIILGGIRVFPYSVIGELIFLIIINFVFNGFEKSKRSE